MDKNYQLIIEPIVPEKNLKLKESYSATLCHEVLCKR